MKGIVALKSGNKRMFYFFVGCLALSIVIIGATFAYFAANATDDSTVNGGTYSTNFSLAVTRITTVDMAYGLVPMKNSEAPHAGEQLCFDDYGNAGCQIYKITVSTDSDDPFFVDGYLVLTNKEGVSARFTRVYPENVEDSTTGESKTIYKTSYTKADFSSDTFFEEDVIKDGVISDPASDLTALNHNNNFNCLLLENEKIGGDRKSFEVYAMIWVYDDGDAQDYLQGMELAYTGLAVFNTAQGNEIKATFD
ncbi:MAG: hypothetical protein VZS44_01030 [Bacilli bacterium]|nr:hypothetical protein [Bacilli bacterium]